MSELPELLHRARIAAKQSYSPYSGFAVGAAIRWQDGAISCGTNVENLSYGLTICAERAAVLAGVAAGQRQIGAVAVWVEGDQVGAPCGACLQVLAEFAPKLDQVQVLLACQGSEVVEAPLSDYLPRPFQATFRR